MLTVLGAGLLVTALGACASAPAVSMPGNDVGTRLDVALPEALTSRPLRTSDGHTVTLDALHGKVVVLSDAMSLCQETCPLDTAALVQTAREVDDTAQRADVVFLSLTVDPQRDTRTNAPLTYDVEHSDEVFFLDQDGHERFILEGAPHVAPGQIPQPLYGFTDSAGHANLATAPSSSWTVAQARAAITWLEGRTAQHR